jgi:hypothetical protein
MRNFPSDILTAAWARDFFNYVSPYVNAHQYWANLFTCALDTANDGYFRIVPYTLFCVPRSSEIAVILKRMSPTANVRLIERAFNMHIQFIIDNANNYALLAKHLSEMSPDSFDAETIVQILHNTAYHIAQFMPPAIGCPVVRIHSAAFHLAKTLPNYRAYYPIGIDPQRLNVPSDYFTTVIYPLVTAV